MRWRETHRADPLANAIAKRHYNCQHPESSQFVPPGRCIVLLATSALWVTSWPFPQFVKHEWPMPAPAEPISPQLSLHGAWPASQSERLAGPDKQTERPFAGPDGKVGP